MRSWASIIRWCSEVWRTHWNKLAIGSGSVLGQLGQRLLGGQRERLVERADARAVDVFHGGQVLEREALADAHGQEVGAFLDALAADQLGADDPVALRVGQQLDR